MGGNKRLRNFLNNYDIPHLPYKAKYETKACHYYREMLANLVAGKASAPPPPIEEGRTMVKYEQNFSSSLESPRQLRRSWFLGQRRAKLEAEERFRRQSEGSRRQHRLVLQEGLGRRLKDYFGGSDEDRQL